MKDTRLRPSPCLNCGKELDAATDAFGDSAPGRGDFTICLDCGHVMVFGKKLRLCNPNRKQQIAIAGDPRLIMLQNVMARVKKEKQA